jgi:hypothetical protein
VRADESGTPSDDDVAVSESHIIPSADRKK